MKLNILLKDLVHVPVPAIDIEGIENDSRSINPGDLFIAYPGVKTDGRLYIQQAISAGAISIVYDPEGFSLDLNCSNAVICIPIPQLSKRLSIIATRFYDNPSQKLGMIGVTGTNGKTTIAYQLAQAFHLMGTKSAYIGTLGQGKVGELKSLANTTPDALCLQHLLSDFYLQGTQQVCMEVSSHALCHGRVEDIAFRQAIYTNLSHDHLDFHGAMASYAEAKSRLFSFSTLDTAIINQDDAYTEVMQQQVQSSCRLLTYGLSSSADVYPLTWDTGMHGSHLNVNSPWGKFNFEIQSLGQFNIYNSLAVMTCLLANGITSRDLITDIMPHLKPSPGRMEIIAKHPCVIVDYAHTPDALENVLKTLSPLKQSQLWVIFGCGGDRDRTKRPIMGKIATQYADHVILTNDNPRSEDPELIINEIQQGSLKQAKCILDRREAIEYAINHASANDIVLIAGKGHENYQIIGNEIHPFSDQAVVSDILEHLSNIQSI